MIKVVEADNCISQVLNSVGAAVSLTGANLSVDDALALLTVCSAALTLVGATALSLADENLSPVESQALNSIITETEKRIKEIAPNKQ